MSGFGGAKRDRTADLLHAMQALSQLSYGPVVAEKEMIAGLFRPSKPFVKKNLHVCQELSADMGERLVPTHGTVFPPMFRLSASSHSGYDTGRRERGMATSGFLLLLAAVGAQAIAPAQVFKCVDGGQVTYQSVPCDGLPAKTWVVSHQAPPVPSRAETGTRSALRTAPRARRSDVSGVVRRARPTVDACTRAREGRDAAYRKAGLKRGFALSSLWDNRVHDACR